MVVKVMLYILLTVSGLTLFKLGSTGINLQMTAKQIGFSVDTISLIGIICYMGSFLLWLNILKGSDITIIFPIATALVTIATLLAGRFILGESIGIAHLIGSIFIIIGVFIINFFK